MAEHEYEQAIISADQRPSEYVVDKTEDRLSRGVVVKYRGFSSLVQHFEVESGSHPGYFYRVEYDTKHKSYRCSCPAGFYGVASPCTHINILRDRVALS